MQRHEPCRVALHAMAAKCVLQEGGLLCFAPCSATTMLWLFVVAHFPIAVFVAVG